MKVMTFNIQHGLDYIKQEINLDLFADFIKNQDVDFCGLNEVRGKGVHEEYTDQAGYLGDFLSYDRFFADAFKGLDKNPYGNAFLTRLPIKSAEIISIPDSAERDEDVYYETRCAIKAVLDVDGMEVMFIVCHIGLAKSECRNAVKVLCDIIDSTDLPCVLMGDFNHEKDSGLLNPLFERLTDTDIFARKKGIYTFPSDNPSKKIDYILIRGIVCNSVKVIEEIVSDHFPVIADISVK